MAVNKYNSGKTPSGTMGACCAVPFFGIFAAAGLSFLVPMVVGMLNGGKPGLAIPFLLLPLVFIVIGVGGIVSALKGVGKSAEKLSMVAGTESALPVQRIAKTPGQSLAWALPMDQSTKTGACCLGIFALGWNGFLVFFGVTLYTSQSAGNADNIMFLFMIPFVAVGIGLIVAVVRGLMVSYGIKQPTVEVDREPVIPGETLRIHLRQLGTMAAEEYTATLLCEERITYRRGTDTYHDQHVLHTQQLYHAVDLQIDDIHPLDQALEVTIPADAVPSFHSSNNEIVWLIRLQAKVKRWPDIDCKYAFRVAPQGTRERVEWP